MIRAFQTLLLICISMLIAGPALAQDPIIFPAKGQSQDQIERDKFTCYQWAKNGTGFDPMKAPRHMPRHHNRGPAMVTPSRVLQSVPAQEPYSSARDHGAKGR